MCYFFRVHFFPSSHGVCSFSCTLFAASTLWVHEIKCILLFISFACDSFLHSLTRCVCVFSSYIVASSERALAAHCGCCLVSRCIWILCFSRLSFVECLCCYCTSSNFHAHDIFCISYVPAELRAIVEEGRKKSAPKFCFLSFRLSTCLPWLDAFNISVCVFRGKFILFNFILFRAKAPSLSLSLFSRRCSSIQRLQPLSLSFYQLDGCVFVLHFYKTCA